MALMLLWQWRSVDQCGEFLFARAFCFQTQQTSVDASLFLWEDSRIAGNNRWSLQWASCPSVGVSLQLRDHDSLWNCCNSCLAINAQQNASISEQCFCSGKWKASCNFAMEPLIAASILRFDGPNIAHSSDANNSIYTIFGKWLVFANLVTIISNTHVPLQLCTVAPNHITIAVTLMVIITIMEQQ